MTYITYVSLSPKRLPLGPTWQYVCEAFPVGLILHVSDLRSVCGPHDEDLVVCVASQPVEF
jgi:hypothetical protein